MILGASQLRTRLCGRSSLTAGCPHRWAVARLVGEIVAAKVVSTRAVPADNGGGADDGTAATSDGNNLVMALIVKRSRGFEAGVGRGSVENDDLLLSRVFSATSAARERSVSRIVASTALVISRSIQREYPAVCSRPGSLRHEHRQDPRHFQVRTEYLRRTRPFGQQRSSTDCARHVRSVCLGETDQQDLFAKAIDQAEAELERLTRAQAEARAKVAA